MTYTPWLVGERIDYLLRNGRHVEARALIAIEWDQKQLAAMFDYERAIANLQRSMERMVRSIGDVLIPSFQAMAVSISKFAEIIK